MKIKPIYLLLSLLAAGCGMVGCGPSSVTVDQELGRAPSIFPDYADCTIPPNIAPLNFALTDPNDRAIAIFTSVAGEWSVTERGGQFTIPPSKWEKALAAGGDISVRIVAEKDGRWVGYTPFELHVASEPVDPYFAYRLIEPGYEFWNDVGIYQRDLEGYTQSPILENSTTRGSCMNCHSFRMQDPERMLFHLRGSVAGTMMIDGDKVEKLNTKTPETMSSLVYPSWHPDGRFVAFSVNDIGQAFHIKDPNRVEAYDSAADVVVYDSERHEILTTPLMHGTDTFESFPSFSPDGRTLYFSSSVFVANVPKDFDKVCFSLCAISFDPETRTFGMEVDTLYNARTLGRSAKFARVSPDGRRLLYTLSDYGGFAIWHKDADLWMIDLATGEHYPLDEANSPDAESYHSWSSNSRWIIFVSRRIDGLYSRPFIAYIDPDGRAHKALLVPQKDVEFYHRQMKSFNIPEFITGKVRDRRREISQMAKHDPGIDLRAVSTTGAPMDASSSATTRSGADASSSATTDASSSATTRPQTDASSSATN